MAFAMGGANISHMHNYLALLRSSLYHPEMLVQMLQIPSVYSEPSDIVRMKTIIRLLLSATVGFIGFQSEHDFLSAALVHFLACGPAPFSILESMLPPAITDSKDLDRVLEEVGTFCEPSSPLASGVFALKREYSSLFSPYYWYYIDSSRQLALEYMTSKRLFKKMDLLSSEKLQSLDLSPLVSFSQSEIGFKFLCDIARKCLEAGPLLDVVEESMYLLWLATTKSNTVAEFVIPDALKSAIKEFSSSSGSQLHPESREFLDAILLSFGIRVMSIQSESMSSETPDRSLAEARKQKALAAMKKSQMAFAEMHSESLEQISSSTPTEGELWDHGYCVVCQLPVHSDDDSYGILYCVHDLRLSVTHFGTDDAYVESLLSFSSCFHLIHHQCRRSLGAYKFTCPLCSFPGQRYSPMPPLAHGMSIQPSLSAIKDALMRDIPFADLQEQAQKFPTNTPSTSTKFFQAMTKKRHELESDEMITAFACCCYQAVYLSEYPQEYQSLKRSASFLKSALISMGIELYFGSRRFRSDSYSLKCELCQLVLLVAQKFCPSELTENSLEMLLSFARHFALSNYYGNSGYSFPDLIFRLEVATKFVDFWIADDQITKVFYETVKGIIDSRKGVAETARPRLSETKLLFFQPPPEYSGFFSASFMCQRCDSKSIDDPCVCFFCGTKLCGPTSTCAEMHKDR